MKEYARDLWTQLFRIVPVYRVMMSRKYAVGPAPLHPLVVWMFMHAIEEA